MKKISIICLIILGTLVVKLNAQSFDWVIKMGHDQYQDEGISLLTDLNGNVYTTGVFWDTTDFDSGPGVSTIISHGFRDIFISKHDSSGNLQWVKTFGGSINDYVHAIHMDNLGNIYLTGSICPMTDLDPGPGLQVYSGSNDCGFTTKFDNAGNLVWSKVVGDYGNAGGNDIFTDAFGNVFIMGMFYGTVDFDPDTAINYFITTTAASTNLFITKLNSSGDFVWTYNTDGIGFPSVVVPKEMEMDGAGNIYITGNFNNSVDFDNGPGTYTANGFNYDIFILKLDPTGTISWMKYFGGSNSDDVEGLCLDTNSNIYIAGGFYGGFDFDPGPASQVLVSDETDAYFMKLDSMGSLIWVKQITGTGSQTIGVMQMDNTQNIYLAGDFVNTIDFDPGLGVYNVAGPNTYNNFFAKYNLDGDFIWATSITDPLGGAHIADIAVSNHKDIHYTGYFNWTMDFDPGPANVTLFSGGNSDIFILKLGQGICSDVTLRVDSVFNATCLNPGSVFTTTFGAANPISYSWNTVPPLLNSIGSFDTSGIYTLTLIDSNSCIRNSTVAVNGPLVNANFELNGNAVFGSLRSGFGADLWLDYYNDGCLPVSGSAKFVLDPNIHFTSAIPAPDLVSGDTIQWNFSNINFDSAHFNPQIFVDVDLSLLPGDTVTFGIMLDPILGDVNQSNNLKEYKIPIISSYDPNIKSVYPLGICSNGTIEEDQLLTYTVQFQNTGNAEAINIYIRDGLDADLDLNSFRIVGQSHPVFAEILPGNILNFRFDNIYLPDSTANEPESHGYVIYTIEPKITVSEGATIQNVAGIFFDYNAPVVTNVVVNTITLQDITTIDCSSIGVELLNQINIIIYPNPTNDRINIDFNEELKNIQLYVYDISGKLVKKRFVQNSDFISIEISDLANGIYFVQLELDGQYKTFKIVKN